MQETREEPKKLRGHTSPLIHYDDFEYRSEEDMSEGQVSRITTVFPDGSELNTVTNMDVGMISATESLDKKENYV